MDIGTINITNKKWVSLILLHWIQVALYGFAMMPECFYNKIILITTGLGLVRFIATVYIMRDFLLTIKNLYEGHFFKLISLIL